MSENKKILNRRLNDYLAIGIFDSSFFHGTKSKFVELHRSASIPPIDKKIKCFVFNSILVFSYQLFSNDDVKVFSFVEVRLFFLFLPLQSLKNTSLRDDKSSNMFTEPKV